MRRVITSVVGWLLVSLAGRTAAADDRPPAAPEGQRVAWLKAHLAPLRSTDPADEDYSDLEPIRRAVGDARVVFLSEELHGVGATFRARSRLIKFLHQRCGFDVLAFESGIYDCRRAWELLREGKMPAREAVSQGVLSTWTGIEELQPMWEYLGRQARQPRPLEICGFDCQFSSPASRRFLPDDLTALLKKLPAESLTAAQRDALLPAFKKLARPGTGITEEERTALAAARKALADTRPTAALPAGERDFWRQVLDSAAAMDEMEVAYKAGVKTERNHINLRDAQMARNLVWLAREAYPNRKIMVWAAAFHLMRDPQGVAMVAEPGETPAERKTVFGYRQAKISTMGEEAWKEIGRDAYSIFFTAAEGEYRGQTGKPAKIKPVIPGSLEDLLVKADGRDVFVDLRGRGAGGRWLEERLVARFLGDQDHEADWTKVCDGVVFLRKQTAATPAKADTAPVAYQPVRDPQPLGVPFDRYTTRDGLGRTVTFYLSRPPKGATGKLPVALFVQGSGCSSVFSERDGKVYGGMQNLLLAAGKGRFRVLVVEKPGVPFGAVSKRSGSAEEGSAEFRREHTLPRWVEAVQAAVRAVHRLQDVDWTRTLAVGHSEGAIVAAHVAAGNALVSHVAVLAGGGPTQLFDLLELAAQNRPSDHSPADAQARVEAVRQGWAKVLEDPDSADKMWLGHPHRRWSSFLKTSTVEGLLASRADVFAAHGTADKSVPVAGFDVLRAELAARGRDLTALRLEGQDHGFRKPDDSPRDVKGFQDVLGRVADWFGEKHSPIEQAIHKDVERMRGTWRMAAMNQEGDSVPLGGNLAKLQLVVDGDRRTVRAGQILYSHAYYRIDPAASPPAIDVFVTQGGSSGQTMLGIYEVSGDRLRVCLASHGRERPRDFSPKAGSGHVLQELRRESP